jgi:hypothetical protein
MLINNITQTTNVKFPSVSLPLCGYIHISSCCIILSLCVCRVSLSLFRRRNVIAKCFLGRGAPFLLRDPLENSRSPFQLKSFPCYRPFLSSFSSSKRRPPSLFPTILLHVWYTRTCFFFLILLVVVVFFISFVFSKKRKFPSYFSFFKFPPYFGHGLFKSVSLANSIISICELCA